MKTQNKKWKNHLLLRILVVILVEVLWFIFLWRGAPPDPKLGPISAGGAAFWLLFMNLLAFPVIIGFFRADFVDSLFKKQEGNFGKEKGKNHDLSKMQN